jgi:GH35 family endo-1,4-beta-xylanase
MKMLVPENELKWESLRPSPTTYDFTKADALIRFARVHGKHIRGHCLTWHPISSHGGIHPWCMPAMPPTY